MKPRTYKYQTMMECPYDNLVTMTMNFKVKVKSVQKPFLGHNFICGDRFMKLETCKYHIRSVS